MKRRRGNVNACYEGKEANLKRPPTGGFQRYGLLEKVKLQRQSRDQWLPEISEEGGVHRPSVEDREALRTPRVGLEWWIQVIARFFKHMERTRHEGALRSTVVSA